MASSIKRYIGRCNRAGRQARGARRTCNLGSVLTVPVRLARAGNGAVKTERVVGVKGVKMWHEVKWAAAPAGSGSELAGREGQGLG